MRVLLVTWTEQLLAKLSIFNPELEYCAIVVDEVEPAKKILERVGLPKTLLHPMYDLKECVKNFHYNYVICSESGWSRDILPTVKDYGVPKNKIVALNCIDNNDFLVERTLRYYKEHASEFDMFATGISYTEVGLDITRFKRKLFNFGHSSQDLYYNFLVAKRAIVYGGGGYGRLKYALIGLAPYSFHYDVSRAFNLQFLMLRYFIAFRDLRNFYIPAEVYQKFFRKEYLSVQIPLEPFDRNNPFWAKTPLKFMTRQSRLKARNGINTWNERFFPETSADNIQVLDDYLTLCEENNIRPIMFLPPMTEGYMKHFNKQHLDEFYYLVGQACKKHPPAIFIDGWKLRGMTDADFYDIDHMNIQGAAKFSAFLNDFIERL